MRRLAIFLLFLAVTLPALAAAPALTQAQEARAERIGSQLRCVVCQNESVEESNASLAADIRRIIREQVAAGRTNHEIMQWMTARYGDFIRLDPPFNQLTLLLWSIPVLAPAAGLATALLAARRRRSEPSALTEAERVRLAELLK
ncbi:MAG TPA: cytochrome c-type biogenesis protein [Acetobacteraceae bacterium]|nr:cytochrome c-type biogenesis protein [Acetobacteraceae bacterium]